MPVGTAMVLLMPTISLASLRAFFMTLAPVVIFILLPAAQLRELGSSLFPRGCVEKVRPVLGGLGKNLPTNPTQRTRNAVAYNSEVSFLAGVAKHEGFPAVPAMRGASGSEIEDDLEQMKVSETQDSLCEKHVTNTYQRNTKPRQRSIMQPIEDYQAVAFGSNLGPAGEQFIKDTPWANPNHIAHKISTGPAAAGARLSSPMQGGKAAAGPSNQQPIPAVTNGHVVPQASPPMNRFISASPEMVRTANVLTQSAQMKRAGSRTSKAAKNTAPKQEPVSAMAS